MLAKLMVAMSQYKAFYTGSYLGTHIESCKAIYFCQRMTKNENAHRLIPKNPPKGVAIQSPVRTIACTLKEHRSTDEQEFVPTIN